jgi:hypothetical protein
MVSVAIFSGNKIDGSMLRRGESFFGLALFGGLDLDLSSAPPELAITVVAIFGGAKVRVRQDEEVVCGGFSVFGGRKIDLRRRGTAASNSESKSDDEDAPLPLDILAYSMFGGVTVQRASAESI